jgi:septal ring-binding cell division protein DamX
MTKSLLIICLIIFCIALGVIYNYKSAPKEIVIIYPEEREAKVRPQDSGGIAVPNSDNVIYDNLKHQSTKKIELLPEPEQPLNIEHSKNGEEILDPIDVILANIIPPQDGAVIQEKQGEAESKQQNTSLNIVKITEKTNKTREMNSSKHAVGSYKIQLASVKSQTIALSEWERIKKKYQKILQNSVVSLKKVQIAKGQFFYIVLAGNYSSITQAKAICRKLSAKQQDCIVHGH